MQSLLKIHSLSLSSIPTLDRKGESNTEKTLNPSSSGGICSVPRATRTSRRQPAPVPEALSCSSCACFID